MTGGRRWWGGQNKKTRSQKTSQKTIHATRKSGIKNVLIELKIYTIINIGTKFTNATQVAITVHILTKSRSKYVMDTKRKSYKTKSARLEIDFAQCRV